MEEQIPSPAKSLIPQLEDFLDLYLVKKAPFQIPAQVKESIVKYGPYITLVLMLLALPAILLAFGLSTMVLPAVAVYSASAGLLYYLGLGLVLASLLLEALALPGLFKRSKTGWNFVFYAMLISSLNYLLSFNILSLILGLLVGLYILFQIRSYYK